MEISEVDRDDLSALAQEIELLKSSQKYAECIQRMSQYEKETVDPIVRAVLLTAKATCSLQLREIAAADIAVSAIDTTQLTSELKNYVNLTKSVIAHEAGRLDEADLLLSSILADANPMEDEQSDVLYEALARKGFIQADKSHCDKALDLLSQATAISDQGELQDNISLYRGYCLQALKRLDEARESLKNVLETGTGTLDADAYYRLGAIEMQDGNLSTALSDFQLALQSLPRGRITRIEISIAIDEVKKRQLGLQRIDNTQSLRKPHTN